VAHIPTMLIRKISGADAPARETMTPVVKNRLKAGAIWARPGMMTPNRPSCPRSSLPSGVTGVTSLAVMAQPFPCLEMNDR
jgi:hypothetical protein